MVRFLDLLGLLYYLSPKGGGRGLKKFFYEALVNQNPFYWKGSWGGVGNKASILVCIIGRVVGGGGEQSVYLSLHFLHGQKHVIKFLQSIILLEEGRSVIIGGGGV